MLLRLPVIFASHGGGPCFFLEGGSFAAMDKHSSAASFFRNLITSGQVVKQRPRAILVVSAHWEESTVTVGYQPSGTSLIYDYYGFPRETYAPYLTFDAPTDLTLADRVHALVTSHGIACKKENRGFDHGVFIPLKLANPEADIPIVQLSLHRSLDPEFHVRLGESLAPLRDEGVLIFGSGAITHNLSEIRGFSSGPSKWASDFTEWVKTVLEGTTRENVEQTRELITNIMTQAPGAARAHPRTEHLIPLLVAFGAAFPRTPLPSRQDENEQTIRRIYGEMVMGTFSIDSYAFY